MSLWNREYPVNLAYTEAGFDDYLEQLKEQSHTLLLNEKDEIVAWYFDFIRDEETWFAIIVDSKYHGKGLGSLLLNLAREKTKELNAWVIDHNHDRKNNGDVYKSPLEFYLKNGFEQYSDTRLELDKISAVKIKWVHQ